METKHCCHSELAYLLGLLLLAAGTALMERANFGMSMVVAPAYLLHLKVSGSLPFFSFGMAEYVLQAFLLVLMGLLLRRFRLRYFGSFLTAVLYGIVLDVLLGWAALLPADGIFLRCVYYLLGMTVCALGIAFLFRTNLPPEAYELFVKELVNRYGWKLSTVKTVYDCMSCLVAVIMSFLFFGFGHFEGVQLGTILCALVNGSLIGFFDRLLSKHLCFQDQFKLNQSA